MAKGAVDLSDQLASYSTPLRKSVKWYKKLAINLLLNTTVINALILYQSVTKKTIQIVDFRKEIVQQFCQTESEEYRLREVPKRLKHQLSKKDGKSKSTRRLCSGCYKQNVILMGRQYARNKTKKVNTFCETCPCKPFMCFDCFNRLHKV
ncbi:hypothetical protein HF086_008262 [Spodoptera exigua]|uniref:PiggyBac transposable element-derived protein domain-containing protein n=1 Tax=Spodoptera exigua TaxID=7107 RepID=A0A922SEW2_SPOEX|nr:hypothetical protein HF086_008262 [Spodoptera exigua]